jgi:hypothetical protein
MNIETTNQKQVDLSSLIERLQAEDNRNIALTNRFQWIMFILAPLYFAIFVVDSIVNLQWQQNVGMLFFAIAFFAFAFIFRRYNREYRSVDYGLPTVEMLTKAVKRYQFWQRKTGLSLLPVVLVDIGISLSSYNHLLSFDADPVVRILIIQAVYIPLMTASMTVGYLIYRRKQKPIRDRALELLKDITGE